MAGNPVDILLDANFDVQARNGDFNLGDATQQNQELILLSRKGDWKQSPYIGVGLEDYMLDDQGVLELHKEIISNFELDGMSVTKISGSSPANTEVQAVYE